MDWFKLVSSCAHYGSVAASGGAGAYARTARRSPVSTRTMKGSSPLGWQPLDPTVDRLLRRAAGTHLRPFQEARLVADQPRIHQRLATTLASVEGDKDEFSIAIASTAARDATRIKCRNLGSIFSDPMSGAEIPRHALAVPRVAGSGSRLATRLGSPPNARTWGSTNASARALRFPYHRRHAARRGLLR